MRSRIVNLGIATADFIARTIEEFPEPKGLLMFDHLRITTGGCAVNCAIDLGKMGIANSLIVKVGRDMLGDFVIGEAEKHGVDTRGCLRDETVGTPFTFVMVDDTGERRFFHTVGTNGTFAADEIDIDFVSEHEYCYIGGVMVMPALEGPPLVPVLKELARRGVATILDTVYDGRSEKWRQVILPMLPHLTYFVPSEAEARAITGLRDPKEIVRSLKDDGGKNIVVKLGEKGICYSTENGENGHIPAYKVERVVDTTGAGDAWDAGFLAGLSLGYAFSEACLLGNATAAFCIQAAGASTGIPDLKQIKSFQSINKASF